MKPICNALFIILLLAFTSYSCTYDNEEDLANTCDTTNIHYNQLIPTFDICASCHYTEFTYRDGIKMDNYENVKASINTGLVWKAINHEDGVVPMPNGLPKLDSCTIAKIGAWINAGMPE